MAMRNIIVQIKIGPVCCAGSPMRSIGPRLGSVGRTSLYGKDNESVGTFDICVGRTAAFWDMAYDL